MHPSLRNVTAAGFWVSVIMGLALPGCANRLGPIRATQSRGSMGHANLPDIVVERSKECVELYGQQLALGRVVIESAVEVNEDGDKVGVNLGGLSENARDFGACIRNVLHDMPIADQSLHDAVKTLKFNRKHAGDSHDALVNFINVVPGVPIVESELVLEADGYTVVLPVTVKVVATLEELIDIDEAALKKAGQMALDSLGYDEIMKRAEQLGWVKRIPIKQAQSAAAKGLIGDGPLGPNVDQIIKESFKQVMTKAAPAALIASQADSPAPGIGDILGVGIIAVALVAVGGIAVYKITTSPEPVSIAQPAPAAAPTPQVPPPPPQPDCPRNESFVPIRTDNATGCTDKKGNVRCYSSKHRPCAGVHTHGKLRYQEVRNGVCKSIEKKAVRCDGPFEVTGQCGSVSTVECNSGGSQVSGIHED